MKEYAKSSSLVPVVLIFSLFFLSFRANMQDTSLTKATLPAEVNKIVAASCTPCHTSDGGLMSRTKLNFTNWANYSPEKQKEKAAKIFSEISKGAMPPKIAREKNPGSIPTKEQTEIIKKWSESFPSGNK